MRLSLVDMFKIVFACAVASLCLVPVARGIMLGVGRVEQVILPGALVVCLVFALMAFLLAPRGPARGWILDASALAFILVTMVELIRMLLVVEWRTLTWSSVYWTSIGLAGLGLPIGAALSALLVARMTRRARGPGSHADG
jgi:SNF family Na+-dependent transporter